MTAIASCTGLLTGLLITNTGLNACTVDAAVDRPTLQSDTPVDTSVIRLEIHLNRRQAILYQGSTPIKRYPIGTGRQGWETPIGTFEVRQMKRNPTWISPFTNERIAASDPRNPLRGYWIGFRTNGKNWIGFHGTLNASSVGKADSHTRSRSARSFFASHLRNPDRSAAMMLHSVMSEKLRLEKHMKRSKLNLS